MHKDHNLVWVDLEMTGLNAQQDLILEIAVLITDNNLAVLAHGPELVIHYPESFLEHMHPDIRALHQRSGLLDRVRDSHTSLEQAYESVLQFVHAHCTPQKGLLAGNSVWQDRTFLARYMPQVIEHLHYRLVDVSTVKELVRRWYAEDPRAEYKKKNAHRARVDIEESIAELRYYREQFFVS